MARIRTIKPEFWTSEQVMDCSLPARLLFIGLWNFCDDHGRHRLAPKTIKAEIFPGDDVAAETIRGLLDELSAAGLVALYRADGGDYLQITGWKHQRIDKRQPPRHPPPPAPPPPAAEALGGAEREANGEARSANAGEPPPAADALVGSAGEADSGASPAGDGRDANGGAESRPKKLAVGPADPVGAGGSESVPRPVAPEGKGNEKRGGERTGSAAIETGKNEIGDDISPSKQTPVGAADAKVGSVGEADSGASSAGDGELANGGAGRRAKVSGAGPAGSKKLPVGAADPDGAANPADGEPAYGTTGSHTKQSDPALRVIGLFDEERVAAYGEAHRRPWPTATDADAARAMLESAAGDDTTIRAVFRRVMTRMQAKGQAPPGGLAYCVDAVAEAVTFDIPAVARRAGSGDRGGDRDARNARRGAGAYDPAAHRADAAARALAADRQTVARLGEIPDTVRSKAEKAELKAARARLRAASKSSGKTGGKTASEKPAP